MPKITMTISVEVPDEELDLKEWDKLIKEFEELADIFREKPEIADIFREKPKIAEANMYRGTVFAKVEVS